MYTFASLPDFARGTILRWRTASSPLPEKNGSARRTMVHSPLASFPLEEFFIEPSASVNSNSYPSLSCISFSSMNQLSSASTSSTYTQKQRQSYTCDAVRSSPPQKSLSSSPPSVNKCRDDVPESFTSREKSELNHSVTTSPESASKSHVEIILAPRGTYSDKSPASYPSLMYLHTRTLSTLMTSPGSFAVALIHIPVTL